MAIASDTVWLLGLDIGSTTTHALLAEGRVLRNSVTGRMEMGQHRIVDRSPASYTPFRGDELDRAAIEHLVDRCIARFPIDSQQLFAGGIVLTGLAAQAPNAKEVADLLRWRFAESMVVTADDPRLESWLAFLGNCQQLSRAYPEIPVINLDIGGGTTNPAWGLAGQVRHVGCYAIGARHVQLDDELHVHAVTPLASRLAAHLGIQKTSRSRWSAQDISKMLDFYVETLEAIVRGDLEFLCREHVRWHEQVEFQPPDSSEYLITLSGGVGELAYACARSETLPATNVYGDLGIDLARRICQSPLLSKDLRSHAPAGGGQATVCGVALHTAELSGATVFLPDASILPLGELPIIGSIDEHATDRQLRQFLELARAGRRGACLQVDFSAAGWQAVKELGQRLASSLQHARLPVDCPLVLLFQENIGKTLGQYATDWETLPHKLLVLDELPPRRARFVSIGKPHGNVVPVSYFGLCEEYSVGVQPSG